MTSKIPQSFLDLINQVFEIEKKVIKLQEDNSINRNICRIKEIFEFGLISGLSSEAGLVYHNPIGECYDETRIDCEASIAGESTDDLVIIDVIKPIIFISTKGIQTDITYKHIVQKAIVIVESKSIIN